MKQLKVLIYRNVVVENCPFCGSDNLDTVGGSGNETAIKCNNCRAKGPGSLDAEAATVLWNACNQDKQKEIKAAVDLAVADALSALPVVTDVKPA